MKNQDLPEGWAEATLGELGKYLNGRAFKSSEWSSRGRPIIRIQDLTGSRSNPNFFEGEVEERYVVRPGDLLVSWAATLGAYIWSGPEAVLNQHIFKVQSSIDRRFHYYLILHLLDALLGATHGSGMVHITKGKFDSAPCTVPPLAEQRRIVERVETLLAQVQAARDRLERVRQILDRFRQSVLTAACLGHLTTDWRVGHPLASTGAGLLRRLLEKGAASKTRRAPIIQPTADDLPDLPDSWAWTALGALTTKIVDGVHRTPAYQEQGIPFVTVRNLTAGPGIDLRNLKYIRPSDHEEFVKRTNPQRGDLLISKDGTLGVVRAIRTDEVFSIFVSVALIKPVDQKMTDFLELALSSSPVQTRLVPTGSGLQHLHLRDLRASPVPLPPAEEQAEIVRRVRLLFSLSARIESRVATAISRSAYAPRQVLAKAFAGELVATEADMARAERRTYESGEELLARVQAERAANSTSASVPSRSRASGARQLAGGSRGSK